LAGRDELPQHGTRERLGDLAVLTALRRLLPHQENPGRVRRDRPRYGVEAGRVLGFQPTELHLVSRASRTYQLDFDDAFVYAVAERDGLSIVSLDADFDRTPRGRKTPARVLAELGAPPP